MEKRLLAAAIASLLCAGLSGCIGSDGSAELTVEGSFTGTSEEECSLALRSADDQKLVDSVSVKSSFREVFAVDAERRQYVAVITCSDGKSGHSPGFYFEPPRSGIQLQQITVF